MALKKSNKAIIINEGHSPNIGDQAILFCLEKILGHNDIETHFISYSGNKKKDRETKKSNERKIKTSFVFLLLKKILPTQAIFLARWSARNISLIFKEKEIIRKAERVFIGGGQLLNNNRIFPFALFFWVYYFNFFFKKNIIILAVGHGKEFTGLKKYLVSRALYRCFDVYLRDLDSIDRVKESYGIKPKYIPDVVFTISDFILINKTTRKEAIVLPTSYQHVYQRYNPEGKSEKLYILDWVNKVILLNNEGYHVKISITDLHQDYEVYEKVIFALKDLGVPFSPCIPNSLHQLCDLIGQSDYVFSGRMHALIIGKSYGCICQVYSMSDKLRTFKLEYLEANKEIEGIKNDVYNVVESVLSTPSSN